MTYGNAIEIATARWNEFRRIRFLMDLGNVSNRDPRRAALERAYRYRHGWFNIAGVSIPVAMVCGGAEQPIMD